MTTTQNQTKLQMFNKIRLKYPEKLTDQSLKIQVLEQWIKKLHYSQFQQIYVKQLSIKLDKGIKQGKKVMDDHQDNGKTDGSKEMLNKQILQAIQISVKAFDKNLEIKENYSLKNVEQIVQSVKKTLKELLQLENRKQKSVKPQKKTEQPMKNTKPSQTIQKPQAKSQFQSFSENISNQSLQNIIPKVLEQKPVQPKPKSNSLFVQKQVPIPEQNIFKGENNFRRPSSRLMNDKKISMLDNTKPRSSAKSNRSKRSHASSRGSKIAENQTKQEIERKMQTQQRVQVQKGQINQQQQQQENIQYQQQDHQSNPQQQHSEQEENIQHSQSPQPEIEKQKKKIIFPQTEFHLPAFKLSTQRPIQRKNPVLSILTNPYIKKTFTHLCKQSYIGGGKTFDQIAQSADIMTLNKWMVFCKEFEFISKIKKKALVDVFQQCTSNKPFMDQKQFLQALIIVQSKMKVDQEDFICKNMCLDSQFAFRQKVATFKVNYAGPKTNFFQQSTIKPLDKYYQNIREEKYQKQRQKQKQFILHQGKFREQIQSELLQRKNLRQIKREGALNSSLFVKKNSNDKRKGLSNSIERVFQQKNQIKSPYLKVIENKSILDYSNNSSLIRSRNHELQRMNMSRRIDPLTYSDIFVQKNSISTKAISNSHKNSQSSIAQERSQTELNKINNRSKVSNLNPNQKQISKPKKKEQKPDTSPIQSKQKLKTTESNSQSQKPQESKPQRQWLTRIKDWAEQMPKSDSQQSDDILRQHLTHQKTTPHYLPKPIQLSRIMQSYKQDEKWLQHNDTQANNNASQEQWQRQTQMQTTTKKQRFK